MNTSDVVSIGSRPLLHTSNPVYRQEPTDVLFTRLKAALRAEVQPKARAYDPYLYEFPGDRTYERYSRNVGAQS